MIFNPSADFVHDHVEKTNNETQSLHDVLVWLDGETCQLTGVVRRTYSQAIRKVARLAGRKPKDIPATLEFLDTEFPQKGYQPSWGKTVSAACRWRRCVKAAINGATGVIEARKERRSQSDDWALFLKFFESLPQDASSIAPAFHPKKLISLKSCADTARRLNLRLDELNSDLAALLYRSAKGDGAKNSVVESLAIIDAVRDLNDPYVATFLPAVPLSFARPQRSHSITIPESLKQELQAWVELASRGQWSITDGKYTRGVSPLPYVNAAKKILTTAERAGALKLADLETIASAFDTTILVAVVRKLREMDTHGAEGAITSRTARGYLESMIPLLERNGEDSSSIKKILETDSWLREACRNRIEMTPQTMSFCRAVVTDMSTRIKFLSLHIQLRKKSNVCLKAAKSATGREAEMLIIKARQFGVCAAFAALETDAVPVRVSNALAITFRGRDPWLRLGSHKSDNGVLFIPSGFVKNRKSIRATMLCNSPLRGLETLRWYEQWIRPLFADHENNDHLFPAVEKAEQPLAYGTFKSWWSICAAACGFPGMNPHMFRHGQASILVAENPDNWAVVAARLGDTEGVCRKNYVWLNHEKLILEGQRWLTNEIFNGT